MAPFPVEVRRRLHGAARTCLGAALVAALPALADLVVRFPAYRSRLSHLSYVSGPLKVAGLYLLTLSAAALLYAAVLAIPRIGRALAAGLVGALFAVHMSFRSVMGEFGAEREIGNLLASEAGMSLAAASSFFSPEMLLWAALGAGLGLGVARAARLITSPPTLARSALLCALALPVHFGLWTTLYRKCHAFPAEPVMHTVRTLAYFEKEHREFLSIPRDSLPALEAVPRPDDNVVLVLDESVRYGFLSINDPQVGTTPFLLELSRRHPGFRDYGLMLAASTCSQSSEAMLLSGATRAPDEDRRALRNPTLFQHARRMGYRTVLLDGWGTAFPSNFLRERDLLFVDRHLGGAEIEGGSAYPDLNAAEWTKQLITTSRGNFVFILKRGAHFHYERAYPSSVFAHRRFSPALRPGESYAASRERMVNSYKNALAFAVDEFMKRLMPEDLNHSTILWASDHGQSLQERGQTYTHCNREIEQAIVPFFTLSDSEWVLANQPPPSTDQAIVYSHHNLYPTVVSLLAKDREIAQDGFRSLYARNPVQPPLYYLYGGLWSGSTVIPVEPAQLRRFFGAGGRRLARLSADGL